MLGAVIGDIAGSTLEFSNVKTKDFPLFAEGSSFTDDTICSIAVAEWLMDDATYSLEALEKKLVELGMAFPYPMGGYGKTYSTWLFHPRYLRDCETEEKLKGRKPYHSCGNGSAMRVAAAGWFFDSLEATERVAGISAEVTHNHAEGIKGAQAIAAAIFMARTGATKDAIKAYIEETYGYNLNRTCDDIRPTYIFADSCPHTVPPAIIAFLESTDFEDAIRLAISLGGDSDTIACMTGGIAEAYYKKITQRLVDVAWEMLPERFKKVVNTIGTLRQ